MPERGPYDQDVQLEKAAVLFLNRGAFVAAIALFSFVGHRRPHHSPLWYGLGNGLAQLAHDWRSQVMLTLAVAALRRSLRENPADPLSAQLLNLLRDRSGLPPSAFESVPAFEGSPMRLLPAIGFSPSALVDATLALPEWRDRMGIVMYLRRQGIEDFVPVLVAAIERDPHPDVRMAALKFLDQWSTRLDVRLCLEQLVRSGEWRQLQPYVSMTLNRIQAEWAPRLAHQIEAEDTEG